MRGDLDGANADEIMRDTLRLIDDEIAAEQEYVEDLKGQLAYGQRQLRLALASRTAILALLSGFDADDAADALATPAPQPTALPAPSPDPLDWSLVRAPWGQSHWAHVHALLKPAIEPKAEPEPVAAMRAAIVRRPPPVPPKAQPAPQERRNTSPGPDGRPLAEGQMERTLATLTRLSGPDGLATISLGALAVESDVPRGSMVFAVRRLEEAGKIEIIPAERAEGVKPPNSYRVLGLEAAPPAETVTTEATEIAAPEADKPVERSILGPTSADALLLVLKGIVSPQGIATGKALELCQAAGIPFSSWDLAKGALIRRGEIKVFSAAARENGAWSFRVGAEPAKPAKPAKAPEPKPATPAPAAVAPTALPTPAAPEPPRVAPAPKPISAEAFIPDELDRPYTGPCSLMNLRRTDCHWPVGDDSPQLYCGKPSAGGDQYCPTHSVAMYGAKKVKARAMGDRASQQYQQANRERRAM